MAFFLQITADVFISSFFKSFTSEVRGWGQGGTSAPRWLGDTRLKSGPGFLLPLSTPCWTLLPALYSGDIPETSAPPQKLFHTLSTYLIISTVSQHLNTILQGTDMLPPWREAFPSLAADRSGTHMVPSHACAAEWAQRHGIIQGWAAFVWAHLELIKM